MIPWCNSSTNAIMIHRVQLGKNALLSAIDTF